MHSLNKVAKNIENIGLLFPHCLTEKKNDKGELIKGIDFDMLKQELSSVIVEGSEERYQFTWPDKKKSILRANAPIAKTLRPCKEESLNFDTTENLYIEGDNLEVLKLLQETYLGTVKMIYIDPPYNTGTDTLAYEDDYNLTNDEFIKSGGFIDDDGNRLYNKFRENPESNGRFHTDWLNMIYPRLKLAKDLLRDDGVIFISIDDNEANNLKSICDEVFYRKNYISTFYIQVRFAEKSLNEKDNFQKLIEQVLVYVKNKNSFIPNKPYDAYDLSKFCWEINEKTTGESMVLGGKKTTLFRFGEYEIKNTLYNINALKETWASGSVLKGNTSGKFFDKQLSTRITTDGYGCLYKVDGIGEDGIGYRYFTGPKKEGATKGKFYSGVPLVRREEIRLGDSRKYRPIINFYNYSGDFGNISHEGGVTFRGGKKPIKMLKHFLEIANITKGDIVLDFFSGSASFAHALVEYNKEHSDSIAKYILVQVDSKFPEDSDYKRNGFETICDLAKIRLKNIAEDYQKNISVANLDTGFRVLKCDSTNMKEVYYSPNDYVENPELFDKTVDNIKADRTPEDLLFQVLLELGILLSSSIDETTIAGKKVFSVDNNYLIACFDTNITDEVVTQIAQKKPHYAIFCDKSFATDDVGVNFEQIFEAYSKDTVRKVL